MSVWVHTWLGCLLVCLSVWVGLGCHCLRFNFASTVWAKAGLGIHTGSLVPSFVCLRLGSIALPGFTITVNCWGWVSSAGLALLLTGLARLGWVCSLGCWVWLPVWVVFNCLSVSHTRPSGLSVWGCPTIQPAGCPRQQLPVWVTVSLSVSWVWVQRLLSVVWAVCQSVGWGLSVTIVIVWVSSVVVRLSRSGLSFNLGCLSQGWVVHNNNYWAGFSSQCHPIITVCLSGCLPMVRWAFHTVHWVIGLTFSHHLGFAHKVGWAVWVISLPITGPSSVWLWAGLSG